MKSLRWIAAGSLVVAMAPGLFGSPAVAAGGPCPTSSGVTVVVDYGPAGGVSVGCAHTSGSGLSALHAAGFSSQGTQKDGPSFVCRINGIPKSDPCMSTPATDSSWHYYYASNGGSWTFSGSGAGNRTVVQGGFEGWRFGTTAAPAYRPLRASSSGDGSSSGSAGSTGSSGSAVGSTAPDGPSSAQDKALPKPKPRSGDADSPSESDAPSPAAAATGQPSVDLKAADMTDGSGPWVPIGAGILIVGLIGAAALVQRRRAR